MMSDAMRVAANLYNNPRYCSESEIRRRKNKIRRERIVRRQFMVLAIIVSIFVIYACFAFTTIMSGAEGTDHVTEYKYYKSVVVHSGDSIWSIASENYNANKYKDINSYIKEINTINSLSACSTLKAGESLIVPYYETNFK
jgi:cell division septal protein FtsQ